MAFKVGGNKRLCKNIRVACDANFRKMRMAKKIRGIYDRPSHIAGDTKYGMKVGVAILLRDL